MLQFIGDVLNFREKDYEKMHQLTGQYSHKVNDIFYYQVHNGSNAEIRYAKRHGESWIKPEGNIVLKDSMACHNFRVFLDKNGKYKAIGGYHCNSTHPTLRGKGPTKLREHEVLDPVWPNVKRTLYDSGAYHNMHANGYYIFESEDGISWKEHHNLPVFNSDNIISTDETSGYLSSDNMPCVFWDKNIKKYRTYIRANVKLGVRYVCTSVSEDLINWEQFEYINLPTFNFNNGNIYFFNAMPFEYKDLKYISIAPTFNNDILSEDGSKRDYRNHSNTVFMSRNGVDWMPYLTLSFDQNPSGHMKFSHIYSYESEDKNLNIYVIKDYLTNNCKMSKYNIEIYKILGR